MGVLVRSEQKTFCKEHNSNRCTNIKLGRVVFLWGKGILGYRCKIYGQMEYIKLSRFK